MPSDEEDAIIQAGIDADTENPEWSAEDFARARPAREVLPPAVYAALTDKSKPRTVRLVTDEEDRARRIGRPKLEAPKLHVNMRVDAPVVEHLRASGKGWQTRVNALLREAVEQGRI
ncbi:hypothetical protein AXE65_09710 [Ventosimonas gracilis]|uniref:Toxin-antitoxin system, antitoxin component n=1 Tax=Ventosimonas gracilis TaxID=1680762 RepID=A0A139SX74_9GAMM|nr:BrnA antitoxin family protein [Ventosimonas gracilis]KXU39223.1 hypothetical protein AXE65_09710 [Ventosimonas gracilis]